MTHRAEGTFTLDTWDQEPYDEAEGTTLAEARISKTFSGDLAGTSLTRILMCRTPMETSAAYVGFERFTGSLAGRVGSFVLHHTAGSDGDGSALAWTVVPDSGTGELRGLRGGGQIIGGPDGGHAYLLDYDLP
ncbi:DUF3224 domain-containing protein [Micromonospora sp. CV4]|uniref:DUF3224 domain-containing protein n=1 Tax=Micromonospora sp. CV4 TaxID=2478711 RepID=UPI0018F2A2FF|nr:DUF3224 domain-containing protein [Micromonospora sp. CV4]